jgi:beta-mannosidase
MFSPVNIDLSQFLQNENTLKVLIHPIPKSHTRSNDQTQADKSVKPAVSYGWDWHPRLVPSGIWDDTYLEIRQALHISETRLQYTLNKSLIQFCASSSEST